VQSVSRDERRRALLDAADRVVQRDGPDASMDALAAEAGITKPILYRWFGDKNGLYEALAERHMAELLEVLEATLPLGNDRRERTELVVGAYVGYVSAAPQVYRFLMHRAGQPGSGIRSQVTLLTRRMGEVLAHGLAAEFDRDEVTADLRDWGAAMVGAVQSATDRWLEEQDESQEQVVAHLTTLLCQGWTVAP
jgi:AcrR family transcriptional regulator